MDLIKNISKRVNLPLENSTNTGDSSENARKFNFEDLLQESSSDTETLESMSDQYNPKQRNKLKDLSRPATELSKETSTDTESTSKIQKNLIRTKIDALLSEHINDEEIAVLEKFMADQENEAADKSQNKLPSNSASNDEPIVLSLIWQCKSLGAAYYNVVTSELFLLDDIVDDECNFNITRALYQQCQPNHVVTVHGGSEKFRNSIKRLVLAETMAGHTTSASSCSSRAVYNELPNKDNNYEMCYHRVQCLKLESEPRNATTEERLLYLRGLINFKARSMIHALGLLVKFLDQHWNSIALQPFGTATFISLNHVILEDIVMIAEDIYKNLSIMQTKQHPSFCKFGSASANIEGISLFHLLNRCQSLPGVRALRNIIRSPTRNINVLNERFSVIEFLMDPSNQDFVENVTGSLREIYRLTSVILSRFTAPQAKIGEWKKLHKTLSSVIRIADICDMHRAPPELLKKICESITDDMRHMKYFIEYVVDFETSKRQNNIAVKVGVDSKLDELVFINNQLPSLLTEYGCKLKDNLSSVMKKWQIIFLPNVGFLLAVHEWKGTPPVQVEADFMDLEYKFTINNIPYYKNPITTELDNTYGNITLKISKRQAQIILKLAQYISNHATSILNAIQLCAELDVLRAFAEVAQDGNYVKPTVVESQIIDVKQSKHPLLNFMNTIVPNDIYSCRDKSLIKVITGPNGCGKSLYLKQVALIVFMAHIGSYVPAESATIGVLTHILMQRPLVDSISLNSSTFFQDLRQINAAIYQSTPNSLIIIDEFGLGTDETSGVALLTAVLTDFIERGNYCPHIFVATHIHRVLTLLPRTFLFEAQSFEYIVNDDGTVAFLYRLTSSDQCGDSFAHAAARAAGLDDHVVLRALEVHERVIRGKEIPISRQLQIINQKVDTVWELVVLNDPNDRDLEEVRRLVSEVFDPKP